MLKNIKNLVGLQISSKYQISHGMHAVMILEFQAFNLSFRFNTCTLIIK